MKLTESLRISWRAITGHKLRSSLTTLGIIIGVGSVIVFMVLGGAFEQNIVKDIDQDQENPGMWVTTQETVNGGVRFVQSPIYTKSDVSKLRTVEGVEYVAPTANLPAVQLRHNGAQQTGGFAVQATNKALVADGNYTAGGPFDTRNEIVLTNATAHAIEGGLNVGETVEIGFRDGTSAEFTVAGIITEPAAGNSPRTAYVPLDHYETTVTTPDGDREKAYSSLIVTAKSPKVLEDTQTKVKTYLKEKSDAAQMKDAGQEIKVQTASDAVEQISNIIGQLTILIAGIAGISLIVGSIGIANIMIVSVTERTREIGIMKAIGARKRDVIQLFIVEALILGCIGALLGVAVGLGFGYLGVSLIGWPMVYPLNWIVIAVVIGMTVGVLSGLYPAWRGARVDPITALRHE